MKNFAVSLMLVLGITNPARSELLAFRCYDDTLMTTMKTTDEQPDGIVLSVEKFRWQNALIIINTEEKTLFHWQTSKSVKELVDEDEAPHYVYTPVIISDDIVTGHRRSSSEKFKEEFEVVSFDLAETNYIRTVNMTFGRYTKFYNCARSETQLND